jgi:hypothetical protein
MEATRFSETSVYVTPARRYIPEDGILQFSLLLLAGILPDLATCDLLRSGAPRQISLFHFRESAFPLSEYAHCGSTVSAGNFEPF